MIGCLIAGTLHAAPERKTAQSGREFVTAKVRAAAHNGETIFVSVVAFDDAVCDALLALGTGEPVCIAGQAAPRAWLPQQGEPRCGLDMVAHALLTVHQVRRRRATAGGGARRERQTDGMEAVDKLWGRKPDSAGGMQDGAGW